MLCVSPLRSGRRRACEPVGRSLLFHMLTRKRYARTNDYSVNVATYLPDGNAIVAGGGTICDPGDVVVCESERLEVFATVKTDSPTVNPLQVSPNGRFVVSACQPTNHLEVWSTEEWDRVATLSLIPANPRLSPHGLPRDSTIVASVDFSPSGSLLAAGCWDMHAKVWEFPSGALHELAPQHHNNVDFVGFINRPNYRYVDHSTSAASSCHSHFPQTVPCSRVLTEGSLYAASIYQRDGGQHRTPAEIRHPCRIRRCL